MVQARTKLTKTKIIEESVTNKIRKAKRINDLTAICRYREVMDTKTILIILNRLKNIIKNTKATTPKPLITQARLLIKSLIKYSEDNALPFDYKDLKTIQDILTLLKIKNLRLDAQFLVAQNKRYNRYTELPQASELVFSFTISNN